MSKKGRPGMKNQKLPRDFRRRMDQFWSQYSEQGQASEEDKEAFYASLSESPKTGLQYLGDPEDLPPLMERLKQKFNALPWDKDHYLLENLSGLKGQAPGRDIFHDLGLIYIQEPAAAMPVASVDLSNARRLLDLCAAPGGKSSQIYHRMNPQATLWSNDVDTKRARVLQQNLIRLGASNVLVSRADSASFRDIDVLFDFIMLDAPCSGEALLRRKPQTAYQWHSYPPKVLARTQRQILEDIWPRLEPTGRLLYATCTFNSIENEELIASFVSEHEDARIVPFDNPRVEGIRAGLEMKNCPDTKLAYRVFPHDGWGEGQFAILLEKDAQKAPQESPLNGALPQTMSEPDLASASSIDGIDLQRVLPAYEFVLQGERLHAVRSQELRMLQAAPNIDFFKQGIFIGESLDGELEPSESWASLQDPKTWELQIDLTDQPQILADLRSGAVPRWPTVGEGLYLLTVHKRGIGWLNVRQDSDSSLILTQALRSP